MQEIKNKQIKKNPLAILNLDSLAFASHPILSAGLGQKKWVTYSEDRPGEYWEDLWGYSMKNFFKHFLQDRSTNEDSIDFCLITYSSY